jgi:hypothetical protein
MAVKKPAKAKTKAKRYGGLPVVRLENTGREVNPIFKPVNKGDESV